MNKKPKPKIVKDWNAFSRKIKADTERKQKAQKNKESGIWSGLGMMGLVGWSVAVPTLAGAGLGVWLDKFTSVNFSWTLTMIILGLAAGCLNAWHWLSGEGKEIDKDNDIDIDTEIDEEQEEKDE